MKRVRAVTRSQKKHAPIHWASLLGWIALCEGAGIVGSVFTVSSIPTWYQALQKPVFNPPNWIFGPVWVTLYFLMGIAAYRIVSLGLKKPGVKQAIGLFLINLALNAVWSPVFFGARQIAPAFVIIAAIWITLIIVIFRYQELDKKSAYLLVPYLIWVSFATVLNYHLWLLNP